VGTRRANVFAGLHVGWAPPRITASISPKGEPAEVGAEQSLNYELGSRWRPLKWLSATMTTFISNFDNQVVVNTSAAGTEQTVETDAGKTRHFGAELGSLVEVGKALGLGFILDLGARYTFARAVFAEGESAGHLLPYAPLHAASANVDVEEPHGVGGQIAYGFVGPQFSDAANTVAEDTTGRIGLIDARHVVDATVHYRHKATGLTARLTVKNALDDVYIVARRPEGIHVAGFRQILVGLRWDYE
jgi:Fe(3+) dicitrate transport protein